MQIKNHSLLVFAFLLSLALAQTAAATGSSGSGMFRRDFGIGASLGSSFFDETVSSTFYQHTGLALGLEADLRLGLRTDFVSLGLIGAYGLNWFNDARQKRNDTIDHYKHDTYLGLGGGFATFNLGGTKDSGEVIAEYYGYASQTVRYNDGHAENPYVNNGDTLSGRGWGIGYGGKRGDSWGWLLYRSLNFDNQKLGQTETDLPTDTHSTIHYQMLVLMVGQSF